MGKRRTKSAPIVDEVTYTPRIAKDKRSFALLMESTRPKSYYEYLSFMQAWVHNELKKLGVEPKGPAQ